MFSLLYLSGGKGSRAGGDIPKQYQDLGGHPAAMHVLIRTDSIAEISEIVIVCEPEYQEFFKSGKKKYNLKKPLVFALSGSIRQESVLNGLNKCSNEKILLHESARPFVRASQFLELIKESEPNATYACPIPFTVLSADKHINAILDRDKLCNIQLPQKFDKKMLLSAHKKAHNEQKVFSDDSSLLFHYTSTGISILQGSTENLKITDPLDLKLASLIYSERFNDLSTHTKKSLSRSRNQLTKVSKRSQHRPRAAESTQQKQPTFT